MQRREFLGICAAGAYAMLTPNLLASTNKQSTIYAAPALASIMLAKAALETNTNIKIWKNPDELKAGVASGAMQIMMSPVNVCTILRSKGFDVGYVNFLTTLAISLISKNAPINELKQLEQKSIILPFKNDMPDIVLKTLLTHKGVDINKINFIYTNTPLEAVALFLSKDDIHAAYLPEPMASAAKLKAKLTLTKIHTGVSSAKLWQECFGQNAYQAGIIANRKLYDKSQEYFARLDEKLKLALDWTMQHKDQAAALGAKLLNAPQPAIQLALQEPNLCVVNAKDAKKQTVEFLHIIHEYNPKLANKEVLNDIFLG